MDINISQCNKETMINGFAARKHDVATLKEAMRIKYRPFKDAEECWQEMLKHQPFGWVKDKGDGAYVMVTKVSDGRDKMAINESHNWRLDRLLEYYTFADGTPFGIKEE